VCWLAGAVGCRAKISGVGEFAVVGMARFWLQGVQARDCGDSGVVFKQEIVEIVVYCTRLWLAWCLVLGAWFWFSSIPFHSISVRSGGVCVLAGWRSRLQGEDQWCVFGCGDVGWRCVFCWWCAFVRSFFVSAAAVALWFDFVRSEVCVRGSSTSFVGVM
jgi:hypothetical protein